MKSIRPLSWVIFATVFALVFANCGSGSSDKAADTTDPTADASDDTPAADPVVTVTCTSGNENDCDSDGTLHSCDTDDYDSSKTAVKEACDDDADGFVDIFCAQYADTNGDKIISDDERTAYGLNCDVCPDDYDPYQDDSDGDGYGDACDGADADEDGYLVTDGDCDDNNADIHPLATEIADDGIDQDCNGADQITLPDDQPEETTAVTSLKVTIDSLTETASIGDPITVNYTVTNNSDAEAATDFLVEIRIHDKPSGTLFKPVVVDSIPVISPHPIVGAPITAQKVNFNAARTVAPMSLGDITALPLPNLVFTSFCTDANPCTTLESDPISLVTGLSESYTATVTPSPSETGSYYFVVRVMDATGTTYYTRDAEIVKFE